MKKTADNPPASASYRSFLGIAVVFLMLLLATAGYRSWRDLAAARAHASDLRGKISATGERIEYLRDFIERVEHDPLTLERLAREDLGLVRPGDVVIVLPEESTVRP